MLRYDGQIIWIGCGHCDREIKRWTPTEDDVRRFEQGRKIHDDHCTRAHDVRAAVDERIHQLAAKRAAQPVTMLGQRMANPQIYAGKVASRAARSHDTSASNSRPTDLSPPHAHAPRP